jgi:hypothetical protein
MKLFVSYSRVDKSNCDEIVELLRAHNVWVDEQLYGGQNWWETIEEKLAWCEGFIYLLSNESLASFYCVEEYNLAVRLGKEIIPIIIRPRIQIPDALNSLKRIHHVDYTNKTIHAATEVLNSVLNSERFVYQNANNPTKKLNPLNKSTLTFNYALILENDERLMERTRIKYFTWVDRFLIAVGAYEAPSTRGRKKRMESLKIALLVDYLTTANIRAWLNSPDMLDRSVETTRGAKEAIKNLVNVMFKRELIDAKLMLEIDHMELPKKSVNQTPKNRGHLGQN